VSREGSLSKTAADLREAFDRSFAEPVRPDPPALLDFLSIGIGEETYALPLDQTSGVIADRPIVPVPSPLADLLGVAGVRGSLVPVYSLRALLGYPADGAPTRWLVLAGKGAPIGLAFERFHGHSRAPGDAIVAAASLRTGLAHVAGAVRFGGSTLPVVDVQSIIDDIERRIRAAGPSKER
jgi:chemotaxis signal transduction protein